MTLPLGAITLVRKNRRDFALVVSACIGGGVLGEGSFLRESQTWCDVVGQVSAHVLC